MLTLIIYILTIFSVLTVQATIDKAANPELSFMKIIIFNLFLSLFLLKLGSFAINQLLESQLFAFSLSKGLSFFKFYLGINYFLASINILNIIICLLLILGYFLFERENFLDEFPENKFFIYLIWRLIFKFFNFPMRIFYLFIFDLFNNLVQSISLS